MRAFGATKGPAVTPQDDASTNSSARTIREWAWALSMRGPHARVPLRHELDVKRPGQRPNAASREARCVSGKRCCLGQQPRLPHPWLAPDDKRAARAFDFAEERSQKSYLIVPTEQPSARSVDPIGIRRTLFLPGHATRLAQRKPDPGLASWIG